ncbi:MAG: terminase family protein [Deltaproteobacteria bacterium]|jgi:hypothetical protein|nr:terminase family protein [Deltaproteobacteria bacterium]
MLGTEAQLIEGAGKEALIRCLLRSYAASVFGNFVRYLHDGYLMGWFHEEICAELEQFLNDVREGKSPRLMVMTAPRHGKSELVSRHFPAYVLGKCPDMSIIAASYNAGLASKMGRDVQRIMCSPGYAELFPETRLPRKGGRAEDGGSVRRNDYFEIVGRKGSYRSTGIIGTITGMGCEVLIIDDPLRSRQDADSPTMRDKVWDEYASTLYTRLAPGGGILLIQTRWHEDDLAGRLLENQKTGAGDKWKVLSYPAIAEADEPDASPGAEPGTFRRRAGEALHPERYSLEALEEIRQNIGSY